MINVYGKGGHAKMISSLIRETVSFYDDTDYYTSKKYPWFIGIGDNKNRKKIANKLNNAEFIIINMGSHVSTDVTVGIGSLIAPGAIIQNAVTVGNHVIINTAASVDHDCKIGNYCHIAPNSTLCGAVKIGNGTLIGAGSVVLPGIEIGKNCIIGAGSVVTKNIPNNTTAFGNPCTHKK